MRASGVADTFAYWRPFLQFARGMHASHRALQEGADAVCSLQPLPLPATSEEGVAWRDKSLS
jgi:hypothetical protein